MVLFSLPCVFFFIRCWFRSLPYLIASGSCVSVDHWDLLCRNYLMFLVVSNKPIPFVKSFINKSGFASCFSNPDFRTFGCLVLNPDDEFMGFSRSFIWWICGMLMFMAVFHAFEQTTQKMAWGFEKICSNVSLIAVLFFYCCLCNFDVEFQC